MSAESTPDPLAVEAADSETAAERLIELSRIKELQAIVAANPSTPPACLEQMSKSKNAIIRHIVVRNPNTPINALLKLAAEFPSTFLTNPVLTLLSLSEPDFIRNIPLPTWLQLLRCENVPLPWLNWLKGNPNECRQDPQHYINPTVVKCQVNSHIAIAGEIADKQVNKAWKEFKLVYDNVFAIDLPTFALYCASAPQALYNWADEFRHWELQKQYIFLNHYSDMNGELLTELAKGANIDVQQQIAQHPCTPPEVLTELATASTEVRQAVASHPHLPVEMVKHLARDTSINVRCMVAKNPQSDLEILSMLARDSSVKVQEAVAASPLLNRHLAQTLLQEMQTPILIALARNQHTPPEVLAQLAYDQSKRARATAAAHRNLPEAEFPHLQHNESKRVLIGLAHNQRLPEETLVQLLLLQHEIPEIRNVIAAHPRLPLELLHKLMLEGEVPWDVIAQNPQLPPPLLMRLAHDGNMRVQVAVAANRATPIKQLIQQARQKDSATAEALASNPHTPAEAIKYLLLNVTNIDLCLKLLKHPAVQGNSALFFECLMERACNYMTVKGAPDFRLALLRHPRCKEAHLKLFARSGYWQDRYIVALHPATSQEKPKVLAQDGNRYVRAAARIALSSDAASI